MTCILISQRVIEIMENFVEMADDFDKNILLKYIKKCSNLHLGTTIFVYFTAVSFIIVPFLIPQSFPTDAKYPFSTDPLLVRILVYSHQSLVGLQVSAAVLLDCVVALFLWFATARFEIIAHSVSEFQNLEVLISHLQKYREVIKLGYSFSYLQIKKIIRITEPYGLC